MMTLHLLSSSLLDRFPAHNRQFVCLGEMPKGAGSLYKQSFIRLSDEGLSCLFVCFYFVHMMYYYVIFLLMYIACRNLRFLYCCEDLRKMHLIGN